MKILCIIPTFNEDIIKLKKIIYESKKYVTEILVIDDGSKIPIKNLDCKILTNKSNYGKGYSIKRGFRYAINQGYDVIVTMDADGEHNPKYIPIFIKKANNLNGLIVGNRSSYRSVWRKFLNEFGKIWVWILIGKKIDFSSGYKLIDLDSLKKLELQSNGFEIDLEIILESYKKKISICTVLLGKFDLIKKSHMHVTDFLKLNIFFDNWIFKNYDLINRHFFIKKFLYLFSFIGKFVNFIFRIIIR
jgi:hypothetical protein